MGEERDPIKCSNTSRAGVREREKKGERGAIKN